MRRDVFQAIADPSRREIINLLSMKEMTLNEVADNFSTSRPAVSKHVKILSECGLISIRKVGRERYCQANLRKLREVAEWTEKYRHFWNRKLDDLEVFLSKEIKRKKK